jgi:DNA excision repair protein ERCC-4
MHVVVDDREPASVVRELRNHPDVTDLDIVRLTAGDIVVGETAFERKTLSDFVGSVLGETGVDLRDQATRMVDGYRQAYVLLEGNLTDVPELGIRPAVFHGSMASITARLGTPVIPCSDLERLVDVAVRLGRKHATDPSARPLPAGTVPGRTTPTTKRMYGCIDGIGPETADALYEAFPTMAALATASHEELLAIEGIGEKRARTIQETIHDTADCTGNET